MLRSRGALLRSSYAGSALRASCAMDSGVSRRRGLLLSKDVRSGIVCELVRELVVSCHSRFCRLPLGRGENVAGGDTGFSVVGDGWGEWNFGGVKCGMGTMMLRGTMFCRGTRNGETYPYSLDVSTQM